jgi:hypothetical protein
VVQVQVQVQVQVLVPAHPVVLRPLQVVLAQAVAAVVRCLALAALAAKPKAGFPPSPFRMRMSNAHFFCLNQFLGPFHDEVVASSFVAIG